MQQATRDPRGVWVSTNRISHSVIHDSKTSLERVESQNGVGLAVVCGLQHMVRVHHYRKRV